MEKTSNKGFNRVRTLAAASSLGVVGLLGGMVSSARAATTALSINVTTGGVSYSEIDNGGCCHSFSATTVYGVTTGDSTGGFGISDATLTANGQSDAFDHMFGLSVDGAAFQAPGGIVDLTGTTVTAGPATMSGLSVEVQYYFSPSRPVARALYSFTNPTGASIDTDVVIGGEYGSDDDAEVFGTQSGDTTISASDGWYMTTDGAVGDGDDPSITVARYEVGATLLPSTVNVAGSGSDDYFREDFSVSVPAGDTVRILFFIELSENDDAGDAPAALIAAADFSAMASLDAAGLLSGISAAQQSEIGNWVTAPVVIPPVLPPAIVPTLPAFAQFLLAGLMSAVAWVSFRRKRLS